MRHGLRGDGEEVTGLTTPEVDREGMTPTTDEPVLVSNLNRLIAEDRQIFAQRNLVAILIEDRDHRALPCRQVPALENHGASRCHHAKVTCSDRIILQHARHRNDIPLAGEHELS